MLETILIVLAAIVVVFCRSGRPAARRVPRCQVGAISARRQMSLRSKRLPQLDSMVAVGKLDPALKETHERRARWNRRDLLVGRPRRWAKALTLTESKPSDLIRIKLEFLKPFQATNTAEFASSPRNQTVVTWTMTGRKNFLLKGFGSS